jgi:hypothetical protein
MGELTALELDEEVYVEVLGKLVGEARHLQNNPCVLRSMCRRTQLKSP